MSVSVMWFRADLRLNDHPALRAAVEAGPEAVVPLFVLDDHFERSEMRVRQAVLTGLLADLDERIGGLHLVHGDPAEVVPRVAAQVGASSVHVTASHTPYGLDRDRQVASALGDVPLTRTGSAYAIGPGTLTKDDGSGYRVFTPYFRRWQDQGWSDPAPAVRAASVPWLRPEGSEPLPRTTMPDGVEPPAVDERAVRAQWRRWLAAHVDDYAEQRDRPDLDTTSRLSIPLKWGTLHPRTLLADLAEHESVGATAFRRQLAFREFYADVLLQRPDAAFGYWNRAFEAMAYDAPGTALTAWQQGRTGYPIVDAGMRQLLAQGWMHNRVRMIVASFLVKDLHVEWTHGARWFRERLADLDLASNQHGWQWVAGCGTDAAPYFRVFNPVGQAKKFDPDGTYVRRWVPELSEIEGPAVHEPWTLAHPPADYPAPLVDHAEERIEALRRYDALRR